MSNADIEWLQKEIEKLKKRSRELAAEQAPVSRVIAQMQDRIDRLKSKN